MYKYDLFKRNINAYFFYALIEVLIIIVGIYVGFQFDDWSEDYKKSELENKYLSYLILDLKRDISFINKNYIARKERKIRGLEKAKLYALGKYKPKDDYGFVHDVAYGAVFSAGLPGVYKGTYDELIKTGNFSLIKDNDLRKKISDHYSYVNQVINLQSQSFSGYLTLINSLRPFDHADPTQLSEVDKNEFLLGIKNKEFIRIVNLEITFSNKIMLEVVNIKKSAQEIIDKIEKSSS